jgi:phage terminase large subunit GpA-like protein
VEADSLRGRLEGRERGTIPAAAGATTSFVDVQGNRLEAQVKAWGPGEESWLVDWAQFYGDPSTTVPWEELDAWLLQGFKREISGAMVQPDLTLIDAKYTAGAVYDFVQPRQNRARMVFASNGVEHLDRPGLAKVGTARKARVRLYLIATDAAKTRIMSRLKIQSKGPGYIHLPDWVTEEYLEQLTAERLVPRLDPKTKRVKRTWIKLRNRNEALDLEVGCLAGLFILQEILYKGGRFKDLAKRSELRQKPEGAEGEAAAPVTPPPSPQAPIIRKPPANRFPLRPMGAGWRKGGGRW